ncbi:MAG: hypothetical protein Q8936_11460 [Bacillota bacterium]|nr:hypothetical protein [Bacillota bacterium]
MKKINLKQIIIFTAAFILGVFIIVGEGAYKKVLAKESVNLVLALPSDKAKPIVYDIAKEGLPKRLAQPGSISIAAGHGAAGVINKSKKPIALQIKVSGIQGNVQLTSTDPSFNIETGKFQKAIQPGKQISISVTLDIPRGELNKKTISEGRIEFIDYTNGNVIAALPLKVINSREN